MTWQGDRLGYLAEVQDAKDAWKNENDPLKDFLSDYCVLLPNVWCKSSELWRAY